MKRSSTVDNSDPFRLNMRDSKEWRPTSYRSHTIGQVIELGNSLVGTEVTICGYAETVRGRGAICFLMLRDGTGKIQAFLKKDNMDESLFNSIQSASRESTIRVSGIVAQKRPPKVKDGAPPPPPDVPATPRAAPSPRPRHEARVLVLLERKFIQKFVCVGGREKNEGPP